MAYLKLRRSGARKYFFVSKFVKKIEIKIVVGKDIKLH